MRELILAILLGGLFGFALYYVGASNPHNLMSMLSLQNLRLMKVIVFAIGLGSTLVAIAGLAGIFPAAHFSVKPMHLGVLLGGLIFGIGFGLGGTCPGTCVAGIADVAVKKSIAALLGGILGATVFALCYSWFDGLYLFSTLNLGKLSLFHISDKFPSVFTIGYGGLVLIGILFMVIGTILPEEFMNKKRSTR